MAAEFEGQEGGRRRQALRQLQQQPQAAAGRQAGTASSPRDPAEGAAGLRAGVVRELAGQKAGGHRCCRQPERPHAEINDGRYLAADLESAGRMMVWRAGRQGSREECKAQAKEGSSPPDCPPGKAADKRKRLQALLCQ